MGDMGEAVMRLLLIEDDEDDYVLTRDMLAEIPGQPIRLDWERDYDSALAAMTGNRYEVYLLDYRLGQRNGLELLRASRERGCAGPIILLTAQGERAVDIDAMNAGAADFLTKGRIDAALLERSIRYAVERQRDREALRQAHDRLEERVTERTMALSQTNEALRQREEALAEANRRKDEFLSMLAHELRNPLAPICTALHLLKLAECDRQTAAKARSTLERQVGHLTRIVDDFLDVSRITRGKVVLQSERLDLARLLRTVIDDARSTFHRAGVSLTVAAPDLPVWVMGDGTRLTQVIDNLLQNALKFTERGGAVTVRLTLQADGRHADLVVKDNGAGIEPGLLAHLFDTFFQADRSLDRSKGGLGLGLPLVHGLVELHGGKVSANSEGSGLGAEFSVRLPVLPEPAAVSPMPTTPSRAARRLRILLVEDHADSATMLRMLLELSGHEVAVANTGPAGVTMARECLPDVVLCDIGLPGLDGYGVVNELRKDRRTAKVHMIALTGYGTEADRRKSKEAGFEQHMVKPVDPAALERMLGGLAVAGAG